MSFYTITGFYDAMHAARDLGAFEDMNAAEGSPIAEYRRGIVELIAQAFIRGDDDPGTGDRHAFIKTVGRQL